MNIDYVCCRAFKSLWYFIWLANEFRLIMNIKMLFCALVHPILEAMLCKIPIKLSSRQIERVQKKFLRFANYVLNIPCPSYDYEPIAVMLDLSSLAIRRLE